MVEHMAKRRMGRCDHNLLFHMVLVSSLKFCRVVGLPCGSVCPIQKFEAVETVSQHDFLPINRMILPSIVRHTVGVVAVGARRYIDWLGALYRFVVILGLTIVAIIEISDIDPHSSRYVALVAWTGAIWIAWNPLVDTRQDRNASPKSKNIIDFIGKFLFGIYLCAALLLFEKFSIQWIASKFHERSYAGQEIWLTLSVQLN